MDGPLYILLPKMVSCWYVKPILKKMKNPVTNDGTTRMLLAAQNGHLPVFRLIGESTDNKIPKDLNGVTQLHDAVKGGHLQICQTIVFTF